MKLPGDVDLRLATAVWMRNVVAYRRSWKLNILPNFFEPVFYLLGMGIGLGLYVGEGVGGMDYLAWIAPGLLAAAAMNGATFETTFNMFVKIHFAKTYDAWLCTPAQLQDVAFGELMWAVTRASIYGVSFFVVLLGFTAFGRPVVSSPLAVFIPPLVVLVGTLFGLIGQTYTALIDNIDLYSWYYTLFLTPLFLFSGIFFPLDHITAGPQIAWFTPLYHCVRLSRGLCHGQLDVSHLVSLVWVLAVIGFLGWLVPRLMARKLIK